MEIQIRSRINIPDPQHCWLPTFSRYFFFFHITHTHTTFCWCSSFCSFFTRQESLFVCFENRSFFCPSRPIIEPIGDFKTLLARCDVLSRECGRRQFKLAAAPWGRIWRLADLLARSLSTGTKGPFRLASAWDHLVPQRLAYLLSRIEIILLLGLNLLRPCLEQCCGSGSTCFGASWIPTSIIKQM